MPKSKLKICILSSSHSVFDDRIFQKEARTLANAGYHVVLIAPHDKRESTSGVHIVPLHKPIDRLERMTKTTWRLFRFGLVEHALIYHIHDPDLILIGLLFKCLGKKVIYDVHEDFPQQLLYKEWIRSYRLRRILSIVFNMLEKTSASIFDAIVAVTADIARQFPAKKTMIVRNLPVLDLIDRVAPLQKRTAKPIVFYAGWLTKIRGIRELIHAMQIIGDRGELWLLGKWESEEFKKECAASGGWKHTKYLGFVPLKEVYGYMKIADIGICLLYPIKYYLTSLPIKGYEYMACSLPIVMSDFPYWKNTFAGCALFTNPHIPAHIAENILYLIDRPDEANRLGAHGRQLSQQEFNWETESNRLITLYKNLLN